MQSRRDFLLRSTAFTAGSLLLPSFTYAPNKSQNFGVQLYSFRNEMAKDAIATLKQIASLGFKEIETARSQKGHYYGLGPAEMKSVCDDLDMNLKSGHVHLDDKWQQTMEEAVESGQEYLICSSMPSEGQNVDNYKKVAEEFNKAGEACKKLGLKFGYHNHEYEFETENNQVLYDVLLSNTEGDLVHMELDLGWVVVAGKDPLDYFKKYPGRFPLWHLKDMDMNKKESTEFGKGGLDIPSMMAHKKASGVKHIFIEQEEYASNPLESMKHNMAYLKNLS
ncbi:sugar phosphate isomerase/epimerase [uncultured Eudoraea sp.]|jgi:sugar phosphate isomerase/epimerase|uniref:sugar phosphate isomerase/epimerase family protein n=1 Tax=uncultured Eudoraea sp. TaxID=1035614 RepID=UPI002628E9F5|nr:sugar phosphate isomerase/epimerase [uncultured Eudoraea sp.]